MFDVKSRRMLMRAAGTSNVKGSATMVGFGERAREGRTRSFEELIRWDREAHVGGDWHGTLLDYLEKVKLDPDVPKLAHARIYDLVLSRGIREIPEGEQKTIALTGVHKTFNCFSEEFFGIEKVLAQIVRSLTAARLPSLPVVPPELFANPAASAPLALRGRVLEEGRRIYCSDEVARVNLECDLLSRYFDYKPELEALRRLRLAAMAAGAGHFKIVAVYILPQCLSTLIIVYTIGLGMTIMAESSLSFLGLGVQPPAPSWGRMISGGIAFMRTAPWLTLFPGLVLTLTVCSLNLLGDGLRDILDPKMFSGAKTIRGGL